MRRGNKNVFSLREKFQRSALGDAYKAFNKALSKVIIKVEGYFKEMKLHCSTLDFRQKMWNRDSLILLVYNAALLLTNMGN